MLGSLRRFAFWLAGAAFAGTGRRKGDRSRIQASAGGREVCPLAASPHQALPLAGGAPYTRRLAPEPPGSGSQSMVTRTGGSLWSSSISRSSN